MHARMKPQLQRAHGKAAQHARVCAIFYLISRCMQLNLTFRRYLRNGGGLFSHKAISCRRPVGAVLAGPSMQNTKTKTKGRKGYTLFIPPNPLLLHRPGSGLKPLFDLHPVPVFHRQGLRAAHRVALFMQTVQPINSAASC